MRRRVEAIQKQIRNCTDAIADGKRHPSLMEKLSELEQELADTKAKIASCEPRAVRLRLKDARRFAEVRLKEMQLVLNREPRIARAEIGKHVQKITLTPEGRTYIASGNLGCAGSVAAWMVPGARIAPFAPCLSVFPSRRDVPKGRSGANFVCEPLARRRSGRLPSKCNLVSSSEAIAWWPPPPGLVRNRTFSEVP
jgi:hypothetical protein